MAFLRVPLAVLLVLSCVALAACGGDDSSDGDFASCGKVLYSDQADDGAFNIRAQSATCELAKEVAGAARSVDVGADDISYQAVGFSCDGFLAERDERPVFDYTCKNGDDGYVVKFWRY